MSSTNTPVTQADVDEWARDIGAHSDNANGPVYYYVSKAKWDQVHDMLDRLLADRDELRKWQVKVAAALNQSENGGILYSAIPAAIKQLRDRAEKAEAASGVAMLRRLLFWVKNESSGVWVKAEHSHTPTSTARQMMAAEIDRMIAEAEKHAEPCEKPQQDFAGNVCSWKSSKTARQCVETALELADAPSLDDDQLDAVAALLDGPRPKDREGDDVLRALDHHLRAMSDHTDPDRWRGSVESALRTIRRALGEEGR